MRFSIAASAALALFSTPLLAQMSGEPAPGAPTAADAKPDASAVGDKVKADWAKYDAGNKGHLNKAELGKWLGDLRTSAGQPAPDAAWQDTAFTQTDANGDKKVSADELTAFLNSGS